MSKELYGWINLKGEFEETSRWGHQNAECIQAIWDETGKQSELDGIEDCCQARIDADEHPEWHWYEMAQDDFRHEVVQIAYERGMIRVGTNGTDMHFEFGRGCLNDTGMKSCRYQACIKLAKEKGCRAKFENVH